MELWLINIIVGAIVTTIVSIISWLVKNKINSVDEKLSSILTNQSINQVKIVEIKSDLDALKNNTLDLKKIVEYNSSKVHELEVEQARIVQWKKDKENGV